MKTKKKYKIGDTAWIYGVDHKYNVAKEATVVSTVKIDGYSYDHYILSIPTEIEPLLEIRSWHNISQDKNGPVGSIREAVADPDSTKKFLSRLGVDLIGTQGHDEADDNGS